MATIASDIKTTMSRCLGYIHQYGDGLSIDHLGKLLPKTPRPLLHKALTGLVQAELVICGNDSWYYPAEEPNLEIRQPMIHPISLPPISLTLSENQTMMSDKPTVKSTISIRLLSWLEQRDPDAPPVSLQQLADEFDADRDTITRSIRKLLTELTPDQAERLDTAILRRKTKRSEPESPSKTTPVSELQDKPDTEEAWVQEFRAHLLAKRIPEHARHWQETLRNMDRVFAELGVPESQRARQHIQEIMEWLV